MRHFYAFILLLNSSCRHTVEIESAPYGADVYWKDQNIGQTPMEYSFWWYPTRRIPLTVQYFGYRTSVLDVHRSISPLIIADDIIHFRLMRLIGLNTRNTHNAILIPEHGPSGTWTPDDAQSFQ